MKNRSAEIKLPPAGSFTDDDDRRQTPTDASEQNNTGPFGGPVISTVHSYSFFTTIWQSIKQESSGIFSD